MLTTRCPHCHTQFRIRPDQLSQRGGRVRCGSCQQAFSALAHLEDSELDDNAPKPVTAQAPRTAAPAVPARTPTVAPQPIAQPVPMAVPPHVSDPKVPPNPWDNFGLNVDAQSLPPRDDAWATVSHFSPDFVFDPNSGEFAPQAAAAQPQPMAPAPKAPARTPPPLPTQVPLGASSADIAPFSAQAPAAHVPAQDHTSERREPTLDLSEETPDFDIDIDVAEDDSETISITTPEQSPFDDVSMAEMENVGVSVSDEHKGKLQHAHDEDEDAQIITPTAKSGVGRLIIWSMGMLVMLLICILMLSYIFRTEISRSVPALRPILENACSKIGCTVPYPQDAELIYLESHNFAPEPGQDSQYRLVVTLMNKANYSQAWPHLELTVTDRFDIAVARRVLKPSEWLPQGYTDQPAFEGHSEVTANLPLNLSKIQAAGYRLYVFYP